MADACINKTERSGLLYFVFFGSDLQDLFHYFIPYTNCGKHCSKNCPWNGFNEQTLHFGNQYGQFSDPWQNQL